MRHLNSSGSKSSPPQGTWRRYFMCWNFQRLILEGAEPRGEFLRAGNRALECSSTYPFLMP